MDMRTSSMENRVLTPKEEGILRSIGTAFTAQPGQPIYLKGDLADRIYYVLKGRVRVFENLYSGRELTLDVVEAGRIFGESAFVIGNTRPTCVQAVNEASLLSFRPGDALPYFKSMPQLALHFLQLCSGTMDHLTARMEAQCLLDRYGKVAAYILDETAFDSVEKGTAGGVLPYTHEELAMSLGLNRSTVTQVLKGFEENRWLESGYRSIKVLDRQALTEVVERQKDR